MVTVTIFDQKRAETLLRSNHPMQDREKELLHLIASNKYVSFDEKARFNTFIRQHKFLIERHEIAY